MTGSGTLFCGSFKEEQSEIAETAAGANDDLKILRVYALYDDDYLC